MYICMCQCVSMHSGFQLPIVINSVLSRVLFTPTVQHCSMATVIGLCVRVQLLRCLPSRFKVIAIPSGRLIHFVKIEQISCYILPSYQTNVFFYFHILYSWQKDKLPHSRRSDSDSAIQFDSDSSDIQQFDCLTLESTASRS